MSKKNQFSHVGNMYFLYSRILHNKGKAGCFLPFVDLKVPCLCPTPAFKDF